MKTVLAILAVAALGFYAYFSLLKSKAAAAGNAPSTPLSLQDILDILSGERTPSWAQIAQPIPGTAQIPGFGLAGLYVPTGFSSDQTRLTTPLGSFDAGTHVNFMGLDPWGASGQWFCAYLASIGGGCAPKKKSVL